MQTVGNRDFFFEKFKYIQQHTYAAYPTKKDYIQSCDIHFKLLHVVTVA